VAVGAAMALAIPGRIAGGVRAAVSSPSRGRSQEQVMAGE
jgi:hypothetical protein